MKCCKIKGMEKPISCIECPFLSKIEDIHVGDGLYKKIARCTRSPEDIEDPWKEVGYFVNNICEWCPIEEVEE